MSQWSERIKSHAVWRQLESLGPAIDQAVGRDGTDAEALDGLERLRVVLTFIGKRLATADQATTPPTPLDNITNSLQVANNEIQGFVSDGNVGHIANANTHGDAALSHLANVPIPATTKELAALKDATGSYRSTMEDHLKRASTSVTTLNAESDNLSTKLKELGAELTAERQKLTELASEFQKQFSTAQDTRSKEYTDAQGVRQEKFGALSEDFTQRKEEAFRQLDESLKTMSGRYNSAAEASLEKISEHLKKVEQLVGVIGNLGVTSAYVRTANYSRWSALGWQAITVASLGGLIWVAAKVFAPLVAGGDFHWESFAGRVFLSLTVGVLAAYAAHQADKHMHIERQNRKTASELEALGPFLAPLQQQDQQDEFRREFGKKTFAKDDALPEPAMKSPSTVADVGVGLHRDLLDRLPAIIKAIQGK